MREALAAVFPATTLQTCIVHLIRNSLDFANWKERKPLARGAPADLHGAQRRGRGGGAGRLRARPVGPEVPHRRRGLAPGLDPVIPFFAFPPEVRRVIYTTNAIESVHAQLRKIIKTRGHFPTDEAATKLIWLALRNITADWAARARPLAGGDEPVRDTLRGSLHAADRGDQPASHTKFLTLPARAFNT